MNKKERIVAAIIVTIGNNYPSNLVGKKGIIKVQDKFFSDDEVSQLSVVAPNVVLNIPKVHHQQRADEDYLPCHRQRCRHPEMPLLRQRARYK